MRINNTICTPFIAMISGSAHTILLFLGLIMIFMKPVLSQDINEELIDLDQLSDTECLESSDEMYDIETISGTKELPPYKKIVTKKDGFILSKIPQYDYHEDVFFELEDASFDPLEKYVIAYKYLQDMDQPFKIQTPDGFAKVRHYEEKNRFIYEIPTFDKNFRDDDRARHLSTTASREAFLVYNFYKVKSSVKEKCLAQLQGNINIINTQLIPEKTKRTQLNKDKNGMLTEAKNNDRQLRAITDELDALKAQIKTQETELEKIATKIALEERNIAFYRENFYGDASAEKITEAYQALFNLKEDSAIAASAKKLAEDRKTEKTKEKTDRIGAVEKTVENSQTYKDVIKQLADLKKEIDDKEAVLKLNKAKQTTYKQLSTNNETKLELMKIGGIVKGKQSKTIAYELGYRVKDDKKSTDLNVRRMGNFPSLTSKDMMYVSIINRIGKQGDIGQLEGGNYNIGITYDLEDSSLSNPTELRPVFKVDESVGPLFQTGSRKKLTVKYSDKVYQDLLFHFGKRFPSKKVIDLNINADVYSCEVDTEKKVTLEKVKHVTLLEEKFPVIRGLYRFNLSTGLMASFVEKPSFDKVLNNNALDSTKPTYFIQKSSSGDPDISPVLAFTAYWKPVDIYERTRWTDWIPNPTIGFDVANPTDDFFVGGSSEFIRNIQIIYGWNFAKVDKLTNIQDLDSDSDPAVSQSFDSNFFIGVTFNINLVPLMFNKYFKKEG